jgi:hypothetical protein
MSGSIQEGDIGMAQHGEGWDRERGWRGRDEDRERDWREREWRGTERNRSFMIGDRGRDYGDEDDRGQDERPDEFHSSSWTGRSGYGREHGFGGFQGDYSRSGQSQGGFGGRGDWERGRTSFSAHPDDHYRSWRDKQVAALDRDYADYCREREQQFHSDFDEWRRRRRSSPEPLQTGMTQTGLSADPSGMTQAESEMAPSTANEADPMADATLGTSSSRRRR